MKEGRVFWIDEHPAFSWSWEKNIPSGYGFITTFFFPEINCKRCTVKIDCLTVAIDPSERSDDPDFRCQIRCELWERFIIIETRNRFGSSKEVIKEGDLDLKFQELAGISACYIANKIYGGK